MQIAQTAKMCLYETAIGRDEIRPLLLRAGILGASTTVLLVGPICVAYWLFAGESIETVRSIAVKSIFAGVLGILVTPILALLALSEGARQ